MNTLLVDIADTMDIICNSSLVVTAALDRMHGALGAIAGTALATQLANVDVDVAKMLLAFARNALSAHVLALLLLRRRRHA